MLNRLASFFVRIVERWMPDPFLFCLLLTLLTYVLALGLTPASPLELTTQWYDGLWKILPFAMQMILILLTGYTLASSRPVRQVLERIASAPRSQGSAIVVLTVVSALASLVNWGFALVASALLAKEMGRRVPGCDFGFLVAGAYSGFVIWASGASSSIALVSATAGSEMNLIARYTGVETVALSQTLLAPMNLVLVAGTFLTLPLMFPAVLAGTLLAFTFSFDDVIISLFVQRPGTSTLPIHILSSFKPGLKGDVAAIVDIGPAQAAVPAKLSKNMVGHRAGDRRHRRNDHLLPEGRGRELRAGTGGEGRPGAAGRAHARLDLHQPRARLRSPRRRKADLRPRLALR